MKGIKRNKIEDLSKILTNLKLLERSVDQYNEKYHADLYIGGFETIKLRILQGIKQIQDEPEVDPFEGVMMKGGKK